LKPSSLACLPFGGLSFTIVRQGGGKKKGKSEGEKELQPLGKSLNSGGGYTESFSRGKLFSPKGLLLHLGKSFLGSSTFRNPFPSEKGKGGRITIDNLKGKKKTLPPSPEE